MEYENTYSVINPSYKNEKPEETNYKSEKETTHPAAMDENALIKPGNYGGKCLAIWAVISSIIIFGLSIGVITLKNVEPVPLPTIKWCTMDRLEYEKCVEMASAVGSNKFETRLMCVRGRGFPDCLQKLTETKADAMVVNGSVLLKHRSMLDPVMAEDYGSGDTEYWTVAVARKNTSVALTPTLLQHAKSCHPGYDEAGWKIPIGLLMDSEVLSPPFGTRSCEAEQLARRFFSEMCVPGSGSMCSLCSGSCDPECVGELYCGFSGALHCLVEEGDVAFVRHDTVAANTNGNNQDAWAEYLSDIDFELLCLDGTRAPVEAYEQCHLARVPSRTVVVSHKATSKTRASVVGFLQLAQVHFGPNSYGKSTFKMFTAPRGSKSSDKTSMFKPSTQRLLPLSSSCSPDQFVGPRYRAAIEAEGSCLLEAPGKYPDEEHPESCVLSAYQSNAAKKVWFRWCVTSREEAEKCHVIALAAAKTKALVKFGCVKGDDVRNCVALVSRRSADVMTLTSAQIFEAGRDMELEPLAAEVYSAADDPVPVSDYVVAVVKVGSKDVRLDRTDLLRNKSACFSHDPTIFQLAVGCLAHQGVITIEPTTCNMTSALYTSFNSSCAPYTNPGYSFNRRSCGRNGRFATGDAGAMRCLEQAGDIAFVKHSTMLDTNVVPDSSQYRLLCTGGSQASVDDYRTCHLAKIPSNAVMISSSHSATYREKAWHLLKDLQKSPTLDMFSSSTYTARNLLFQDSTTCLAKTSTSCTWRDFLGRDYLRSMYKFKCILNPPTHDFNTCHISCPPS